MKDLQTTGTHYAQFRAVVRIAVGEAVTVVTDAELLPALLLEVRSVGHLVALAALLLVLLQGGVGLLPGGQAARRQGAGPARQLDSVKGITAIFPQLAERGLDPSPARQLPS